MVCPCGIAQVDGRTGLLVWMEFREEEGAEMDGTCTGDGLERCYLFVVSMTGNEFVGERSTLLSLMAGLSAPRISF